MRDSAGAAGASLATVLVADDNVAKRYVTRRWLQQAGFDVVEAETGLETLQRARDLPDLVVLDVRLPDISGFEVCRRIKSHPRTGHIPVLHLSALAQSSEDRVAGLEGGADAYLTQPVEPAELTATVRALLRIRRTESALRASEERYRLVARATNDVIWDWDLATGEVVWNQAAETLFRCPAREIRPHVDWWRARIHPADRGRVTEGLRAVTAGRGEHWADEYRVLRGDGGYATVFDRGYVAHDEHGAPVRMIGSMLDVTERKVAEEGQQFLAEAATVLAASLDYETTLGSVARLVVPRLADCAVVYAAGPEGGRLLEVTAAYPALAAEARERVPAAIPLGGAALAHPLRGEGPALQADLA
ncbi:MAG: Chemotaxis protein methyltransferase CheR, partial [uncultured Gemmatimonadaceae bacterium]